MIKRSLITITVLAAAVLQLQAALKPATPVKLSLVPPLALFDAHKVNGFDFGLLASVTEKVNGVQYSFIYGKIKTYSIGAQAAFISVSEDFDGAKWGAVTIARDMRGYHSGFVCLSRELIGYQSGFFTMNKRITGMQVGFVNVSDEVSGLQLGFVNYTKYMRGVQVGLINIITKSSLPVMVLVNASFE